MAVKTTQFLALVLIALALVPGGAHLFELPHKMSMDLADYFTVQRIYSGWAFLGVFTLLAPVAAAALAVQLRNETSAFYLAVFAALCLAAVIAVFFIWTYPANVATANWTQTPANWETLRTQWEYSHAANAFLTFVAFCTVALATILRS